MTQALRELPRIHNKRAGTARPMPSTLAGDRRGVIRSSLAGTGRATMCATGFRAIYCRRSTSRRCGANTLSVGASQHDATVTRFLTR